MKDNLFNELIESIREAGTVRRGEALASRVLVIDEPNVKRLRSMYRLSQGEFAALLGISVKTLRNWEQGRRRPEGPARVLLLVAARHPEALWDVVRPLAGRRGEASSGERRARESRAHPRATSLGASA